MASHNAVLGEGERLFFVKKSDGIEFNDRVAKYRSKHYKVLAEGKARKKDLIDLLKRIQYIKEGSIGYRGRKDSANYCNLRTVLMQLHFTRN